MRDPAKIDGSVFYNAAKRNGLDTSNKTLNMILKTAKDKKISVSKAAKEVAKKLK
tara:strand:+ start:1956 stop:2120 length:165 start_codon:yes stop_codon:yes gene_type:complete